MSSYEKKNALNKAIDKVLYSNNKLLLKLSVCVESTLMCCFKLGTNMSDMTSLQWKHWSQIRSTIYNISIKIGQSGSGNR